MTTPLTNEEVQRIVDDAKKATDGKWWPGGWRKGEEFLDKVQAEPYPATIVDVCDTFSHANRDHIANTSPAVIVPLLEELIFLRSKIMKLLKRT